MARPKSERRQALDDLKATQKREASEARIAKIKEEQLFHEKAAAEYHKKGLNFQGMTLEGYKEELRIQEQITKELKPQEDLGKEFEKLAEKRLKKSRVIGMSTKDNAKTLSRSVELEGNMAKLIAKRLNSGKKLDQDQLATLEEVRSFQDDLAQGTADEEAIQDRLNKMLLDKSKYESALGEEGFVALQKQLEEKVSIGKAQELQNQALSIGDDLMGGMLSSAKDFKETLIKTPLIAILMAAAAILKSFSDQLDAVGESFGAIGVRDFSSDLMLADAEMAKLGYDTGTAGEMAEVLASQYGVAFGEAIKLAPEIADMSKALGMSTDDGAALVGQLKTMAGLSTEGAIQLAKQTEMLATAEGVAPSAVLKDIAESSESMAKFTADGGKNIALAAIQAKKLGVSLDDVAGIMDGLLDFQTSLEAEMEASVMLGRQLNYQKARELALNNDIEGAMAAVVEQLGTEAEFNALNALERKALADSIGVGVDQMAKFVANQDKAVTLAGELAEQEGFEQLVGEDAISSVSELMGELKSLGATLTATVGPALNFVVGLVGGLVDVLNATIGLGPALIGFLVAWKIKSMQAAVASMISSVAAWSEAGAKLASVTLGFGAIAGIALAATGIAAMFSAVGKARSVGDLVAPAGGGPMVSTAEGGLFQGTSNDDVLMAPGIASAAGGGGTADNTETNNLLKSLIAKTESNIEQNKQYHNSADDRAIQQGRQTGKQFGRLATAF